MGWGSGPLGAATRSPRRRLPFHFFSRLCLVLETDSGFGPTTDDDDDETGLTPDPIPRTENRQNFIAKIFFGDFNKLVTWAIEAFTDFFFPIALDFSENEPI